MAMAKTIVMCIFRKDFGWVGHIAQSGKVKILHSVATGFAYNKCVIVIHFYVPPSTIIGMGREFAKIYWIYRIRNVNKCSPIAQAHYCIFLVVLRVGPSPRIISSVGI